MDIEYTIKYETWHPARQGVAGSRCSFTYTHMFAYIFKCTYMYLDRQKYLVYSWIKYIILYKTHNPARQGVAGLGLGL